MPDAYITPWWQAVLLPDRWDICGIEVRAMSVWHLFALEQLHNAYVCGGVYDLDAAANLLLICARNKSECRALYLRPHALARALKSIHKLLLPLNPAELDAACLDYYRACTRVPERLRPVDGSAKPLNAPFQLHIVLCLCDCYGMTEDRAWNWLYADARCKFDVYQESRGDESLANDTVQQHTDEALERKLKESRK